MVGPVDPIAAAAAQMPSMAPVLPGSPEAAVPPPIPTAAPAVPSVLPPQVPVPPPGMPPIPPSEAAPQFAPPVPIQPPGEMPPPPAPPPTPEEMAAQQEVEDAAERSREEDAADDHLGAGERPRRGSTMEHPLDRASAQLASELQGNAKRLAGDLFPNGPAGTVMPSKEALGAYMRRHWDDPQFRTAMLNRMAPKGPDGNRVPWGVKAFLDLYKTAVEPHRLSTQVGMTGTEGFVGQGGFVTPQPKPATQPVEDTGQPSPTGINALP